MQKITYKDKELEVEYDTKIINIMQDDEQLKNKKIIACTFNNEIKSLDYPIRKDVNIKPVYLTDRDGRRVYIRGLMYIMCKAFYDIYPKALLTVNYQLYNSMFCEIDNMEVTEEMVKNVNKRMREIIEQDLEIKKVILSKKEAKEFYEKEKNLRGIIQLEDKQKEEISLYYCEEYYNFFFGVMPISTGYMTQFEILKYKDGFLLRYPDSSAEFKLKPHKESNKLLELLDEYEEINKTLNINTLYKLNTAIREGRAIDIITLNEALHEKKIANIADQILKRKETKIVLIAGPSSSGKTTFAQRLGVQLRLNGLKPITISVDNYFVEREKNPKDENGEYDFETIEAIDLELFNDHLNKLLKGEEIDAPTFDFTTGKKVYIGQKMKLEKDEILVIEGIHCLNDRLTSIVPKEQKFKVYISALTVLNIDYYNRISTTDARVIRRIVRDNEYRGYSALHTLSMWDSVNRGETNNIFAFQEYADVMFNSTLVYEFSVLKEYAMPLLAKIDNSNPEYSEAKRLYEFLKYFEPISGKLVPDNSLLKEFIGGSVFHGE